jgi:hypothetical protein
MVSINTLLQSLMFILVSHTISMPAEFWGLVQKYFPHLPEDGGKRVVSIFPNENMDQCTCIWEADSIEMLNEFLKNKIGKISRYSFYQVNEANAIGLST